jgi:hypothetical protein
MTARAKGQANRLHRWKLCAVHAHAGVHCASFVEQCTREGAAQGRRVVLAEENGETCGLCRSSVGHSVF